MNMVIHFGGLQYALFSMHGSQMRRQRKRPLPCGCDLFIIFYSQVLALTSFEPALRLVDNIDAALTAHDAAIAVALLERAEGVTYLHGRVLHVAARGLRLGLQFGPDGPVNSWWTILGSNQ